VERRTLENAHAIHATSKMEVDEMGHFSFRLPSIFIVPNGVTPVVAIQKKRGESYVRALYKEPYILFLGRINWKKGLDRLITAMRELPGVTLVVAGNDEENYQKRLVKMARDWDILERIVFLGEVDDEQKAALLSQAQLLVMPSYSENFGNVALEAMLTGCPVVVSKDVGIAPIVEESGAGIVVDGEPSSLVLGIRELLDSETRRAEMGRKGKLAAKQYTWENIARNMIKQYSRILEGTYVNWEARRCRAGG